MFDVPWHLIQHIASDLSGPWCDSSLCKKWMHWMNFLYKVFEDSRQKGSFLYLFIGLDVKFEFLMNVVKVRIPFHLRG